MQLSRLRTLVALLSVALAGGILGLTLGLWERSSIVLDELRDVVGRHTWLVEQIPVAGLQPPPLPRDESRYEALLSLPGVQAFALATGSVRLIGTFNYPLAGVSDDFFAVRRLELAAGRYPERPGEAVAGQAQAALLGQEVEVGGLFGGDAVRVVGVLETVAARGWLDAGVDETVFVPLEDYAGVSSVDQLYLELSPESFEAAGRALERWLEAEGVEGFRVVPLADNYGVALRDRVASLLRGALGFGVVAALAAAGANLVAFYLARALSRVRQTGMRRALGATRRDVLTQEVASALPWAGAGLALSLPLIYLGSLWLERSLGLSALPGPLTLLSLALGMLALVLAAALVPALWTVRQPPAQAVRGLTSSLPQRRLYLAGAGLALGVAGLVLQASSARSAELETVRLLGNVSERVAVLGSVMGAGVSFGDPRAQAALSPRDVEAFRDDPIAERFSRVAYTVRYLFVTLSGPAGTATASVRAHEPSFPELIGADLVVGRFAAADALEVVIGEGLAQELFGGEAVGETVGETLAAFGREWTVVGVFRTGERGIPGGVSSGDALLPLAQVRARGGFSVGSLAVEVAPGYPVEETLEAAAAVLTARFDAAQFLPFSVLRPADDAAFLVPVRETLRSLAAVYRLLAFALLLLGGAGLAAQMLVALSLRVREIGIRRAVGASEGRIFRQFLAEALALGAAAAAVGLALGVALSFASARVQGVVFALDGGWLVLAVGVVLAVAALFASGPSLAAARVPPARTMREAQG